MALTLLVGGFFGDEGKGKIAAFLALKDKPFAAVRTGAVNAGHTVVHEGRKWKLRAIPSFFLSKETKLYIAAGALVRMDVLQRELEETGAKGRLWLDYKTGIIDEEHVRREREDEFLVKVVGTTGQGVGAAMADRVFRRLKLARDYPELKDMLADVALEVNEALDKGLDVYIEGTQGAFLSLYHGDYPYVTSRDTTAAALLSEVGVGPKKVDEIIIVFKAYVTRVGGGPLPGELSEEEALRRGWLEIATVTGRKRRAAPFNFDLARRAIMLNSATQAAITKIDVLFPEAAGKTRWEDLPREARDWIEHVENELKIPVTIIGTGEEAMHTIDRRKEVLGP